MAGRRRKAVPVVDLPRDTALFSAASGKKWILCEKIGVGGFGVVFAARREDQNGRDAPFVAKIEPSANGALYGEINAMKRSLLPSTIEAWKKAKKISFLGIAPFLDSGVLDRPDGSRYRFLITERYGKDINALFEEAGRFLPRDTIVNVGMKVVDVLEFLHSNGYVHLDVKGANLMVGRVNVDEVYLADLGLARAFVDKTGQHVDDKFNKNYAHNGTREFTSRDSHRGCPSRRADLETLGYNLIFWEGGKLPWIAESNSAKVEVAKIAAFEDVGKFMAVCFGSGRAPKYLEKFFKLLAKVDFFDQPDYKKLCEVLADGFTGSGDAGALLNKEDAENQPGGTAKKPRRRVAQKNPTTPKPTTPLSPNNPQNNLPDTPKKLMQGLTPQMIDMIKRFPQLRSKFEEKEDMDVVEQSPRAMRASRRCQK